LESHRRAPRGRNPPSDDEVSGRWWGLHLPPHIMSLAFDEESLHVAILEVLKHEHHEGIDGITLVNINSSLEIQLQRETERQVSRAFSFSSSSSSTTTTTTTSLSSMNFV